VVADPDLDAWCAELKAEYDPLMLIA